MASLRHDPKSGRFLILFRYGGRQFQRTLKTTRSKDAQAICGRVEETIALLERGRLEMPPNADPGLFILSDGRCSERPTAPSVLTLRDLFTEYRRSLPDGAKEATSLQTEEYHCQHLRRHLGGPTVVRTISIVHLQQYIEKRSRDTWRGKSIRPDTIKKEIATFRLIWNWAASCGHVPERCPTRGLKYPKSNEKPPFQTKAEIERIITRGGRSDAEQAELWEALYLTREDVQQVLEHVRTNARAAFVYPMVAFVAYTGARRSEMLRSRVDDFDFTANTVVIREKKKSRSKSITYRRVDLAPPLKAILEDWFAQHPGGPHTFCRRLTLPSAPGEEPEPLTCFQAHDHFKRTLRGSPWEVIRGFHIFRHSFVSNLASAGVDQRIIDAFTGHQTEEMRRRYRHLLPDVRQQAIEKLLPGR